MTSSSPRGLPRWTAIVGVVVVGLVSVASLVVLGESAPGLIAQGPAAVDPDLDQELSVLFEPVATAAIQRALHGVGIFVFLGLALFIVMKKATTRMANLAGLTLAALGASLFAPLGDLPGGDWLARVIGSITPEFLPGFWGSLAGVSLLVFLGTFPDGRWTPPWVGWPAFLGVFVGITSLIWPESFFDPMVWPSSLLLIWLVGLPIAALVAQALRARSTPLTSANRPVVVSLAVVILAFVLLWATQPELTPGALDLVVVTPRLSAVYAVNILVILTVAVFLFPVSVTFSIIRYRLFDVDLLVNRAIVYTIVTAVVGFSFFGIAFVLALFANVPVESAFDGRLAGPVGVTLGVFVVLVFQPLRRRVQRGVDRRFYRERYNAQQIIDGFARQMTRVVGPDQLASGLAHVINEAVHPLSVHLHTAPFSRETEEALAAGAAIEKRELPDLHEDSRIDGKSEGVVVPLLAGGSLTGVLELGKRSSGTPYSKLDLDLLDRLAKTAGPALQLAYEVQTREENAKDQQRAANELDLARKIQQGLLPKNYPDLPGWGFKAYYQPAREVGGDFYDWIPLPDGRLGIVIGDVSDKGIPAALVMATCRTLLRSAAVAGSSPGHLLADVNNRLQPDIPPGMFVTCLVAFLDTETGEMMMANAGHNLPYICQNGQVAELMVRGMPLGLMPEMNYEEIETRLDWGGVIVLTSDGLAESHCNAEMFGTQRLKDSLIGHPVDPLAAALEAHQSFVGAEWDQEDDMTVVTVGRLDRLIEELVNPEENASQAPADRSGLVVEGRSHSDSGSIGGHGPSLGVAAVCWA